MLQGTTVGIILKILFPGLFVFFGLPSPRECSDMHKVWWHRAREVSEMKVGASFVSGSIRDIPVGGAQLAMKCLLVRDVIHEMNCFHYGV